jgi:hypothetical protein
MADSAYDRMNTLIREAERLPDGEVKVSLCDEAARLADETRRPEVMFRARMNLIRAGIFCGHSEKAMAAFAWCVSQFEAEPSRFRAQQHGLLWSFKWILGNSVEYPQVSGEQVEGLFQQMASLYRRCGYNMRPVHYLRFTLAMSAGMSATAAELLARYQAEPRDGMADCEACEADHLTQYYDLIGEPARAVEIARPNLEGLRQCKEVPHRVLTHVLHPLALLGRDEEADNFQRRGYPLIRNNREFFQHIGLQMAYLAHRGRLAPAVRMIERHLPWTLSGYELHSRFYFYLGAARALGALADRKATQKLNLPQEFSAYEPSGIYDVAALARSFAAERDAIGARFDRRHGNTFFTKELVAFVSY